MTLPAQVEQDLREIEELEKQIAAQNQPEVPPEEPETGDADQVTTNNSDGQETTATGKTSEGEKETAPPPSEDFKQKYNTLRGKYDAEVPRLHAQVKELTTQVGELTSSLNKQQQAAQTEKPQTPESYVTDADREEYGDDLIDFQRRVAKEVGQQYEQKIANLEATIDTLQNRMNDTGGQVSDMTFQQKLRHVVPEFETLNTDPQWIEWLDTVDPMLRGPRRAVAQEAYARGDVDAIQHYVQMFKETQAPAQAHQSEKQSELEKQITPSRSTTSTTPAPTNEGQGKVYSEAQMDAAWKRVNTLNMSGRYEDAAKLEAELTTALLEGRGQ